MATLAPLKPGARLWTGLPGSVLDAPTRDYLARLRPGGVILFARNWSGSEGLRGFLADLRAFAAEEGFAAPVVGVDQEGGGVQRLPPPFPRFPGAREVGRQCEEAGGPEPARVAGRALGEALAKVGVEAVFAPVLDVDSNPKNPIIGERAFASEAGLASACGSAFALGLLDNGIIPCGKHFPGHGDTALDSHLSLPTVGADMATLAARELRPFREACAAGLPLLMTAHVVYEALDAERPATFSRTILTDLLRGSWGWEGAVVTDDLGMAAVGEGSPASLALAAHEAGADLLMECHHRGRALEMATALAGAGGEANAPALARVAALQARRDELA
ncbi:beta-N-acetylhexosaminidase [bacterium]|nr:beta-N-acetylhexosaminidase [bacterium]